MCCITLIAPTITMATTQFTRESCLETCRAQARAERKRAPHELGRGHRRKAEPPNALAMDTVSGVRLTGMRVLSQPATGH